MRVVQVWTIAVAVGVLGAVLSGAPAQDVDRVIPGGGMHVQGWTGKIDGSSANQGRTLNDAKLEQQGTTLHVTTGPAASLWNPANTASGAYTVKGTFTEPQFQNLSSHPHSYGLFIGGNDLGTDQQSLLYCATYGNGRFIVRGFAPGTPSGTFQMNGRGENSPAVHRAASQGQPVTQEIAWRVTNDRVECAINGSVVGSYAKSDVVGPGKLKSTDGVYGIRATHNVDFTVSGFGMTK